MGIRKITLLLVSLLTIIVQGCPPKPVVQPTTDEYGCTPPPPNIFTAAGVDLQFAQSTFPKVVTGDINIKTNPQVVALASQAAAHDRMRSYLRCLALKRDEYSHEQAAYLDQLSSFMQTNPNPEQFMVWQEKNPFPVPPTSQQRSERLYSFDFDDQTLLWAVNLLNWQATDVNIVLSTDLESGAVQTKRFSLHLHSATLEEVLEAFCRNAEQMIPLTWRQGGKDIFIQPR